MRKKLKVRLLLCFFICTIVVGRAQYSFSQYTAPFAPLTVPVNISAAIPAWDDDEFYLAIGFPVVSFGISYDSIVVESNGSVAFYNSMVPAQDFYNTSDTFTVMNPFGEYISTSGMCDLRYRFSGSSPISYELTGIAGNRIAKIEWKNVGFYNDTSEALNDSANFQLWIYEVDGNIEFRYGASNASDMSLDFATGPTVGIGRLYTSPDFDYLSGEYLTGSPSAATISTIYNQMNGLPPDGTVYLWTNALSVGVQLTAQDHFSIYPNPASRDFNLQLKPGCRSVKIYSSLGILVYEEADLENTAVLRITQNWAPGVYLVQIRSSSETQSTRLVIR